MSRVQMQLLKRLVPIVVASVYKSSIKRGAASYIKVQKASKLQKDLKSLENWTKIWGMQFNAGKCELLRVTRKRKPIDTDYYLYIYLSTTE